MELNPFQLPLSGSRNFFDELGVSRDMFWKAYKELWSVKYTAIPLVEEDAPTTIARLRERCEIHIMTSRPEETHLGTISWLKYRGIIYDKIIMLPPLTDKTKHLDDYLFLVDDSPNFAHHPKVIIYDRPWNRHINAKRRIRSLKELLEIEITAEAQPQRGV